MKTAVVALFLLFFSAAVFAQTEISGDEYKKKAIAAEKANLYVQAGIDYAAAGNAYKKEADEAIKINLSDLSIYKLLNASKESYEKAAENYKKAKKITEQTNAQREAIQMGLRSLEYGKKAGVVKLPAITKDEKPPQKEPAQIPWKPGKEIFLNAQKASFAITMPEALKYNGPRVFTRANHVMLKETETFIDVVGTNAPPKFQVFLKEYIGDGVDKEGKSRNIQDACEGAGKEPVIIPFMGLTETKLVKIGVQTKACQKTNESQQIDTRKYMFGFNMIFYYKKSSYLLSGIGPREWKTAILEMLKTFRIVDEETNCAGKGQTEDVPSMAFEDTWQIPVTNKEARIIISSNLPRGQVPEGWNLLIATMREALKGLENFTDLFEEEKPDEVKRIIFVLNELGIEELTPYKVADAYLDAMDKIVNGLRSLEGKISKMSSDLYYEIPVTEIKTLCTPRLICDGQKWVPDYRGMSYEKLSEVETTLKSMELKSLSPGQVRQHLDGKLKEILKKIESDAEKYKEASECQNHKFKLTGLQFPASADECKRLQAMIENLELQLKDIRERRTALEKQLTDWGNSKFGKIEALEKDIARNNQDILKKKEELRLAIQQKKNFENDKLLSPEERKAFIAEAVAKINQLQAEINMLERQNALDKNELAYLKGTAFETEIDNQQKLLSNEEKILNSRKAKAETDLANCKGK